MLVATKRSGQVKPSNSSPISRRTVERAPSVPITQSASNRCSPSGVSTVRIAPSSFCSSAVTRWFHSTCVRGNRARCRITSSARMCCPKCRLWSNSCPGSSASRMSGADPLAGIEPVHHELCRAEPDLVRFVGQAQLLEDRDGGVKVHRRARGAHDLRLAIEHGDLDALAREPERGQQPHGARADDGDLSSHAAATARLRRARMRGLVSIRAKATKPGEHRHRPGHDQRRLQSVACPPARRRSAGRGTRR